MFSILILAKRLRLASPLWACAIVSLVLILTVPPACINITENATSETEGAGAAIPPEGAEDISTVSAKVLTQLMSAVTMAALGYEAGGFIGLTSELPLSFHQEQNPSCASIDETFSCPAGGTVQVAGFCMQNAVCLFALFVRYSFDGCEVPLGESDEVFVIDSEASGVIVTLSGCIGDDVEIDLETIDGGITVTDTHGGTVEIDELIAELSASIGSDGERSIEMDSFSARTITGGMSCQNQGDPMQCCDDSDLPRPDFICDDVDNCISVPNADQVDSDGDGLGDDCDL